MDFSTVALYPLMNSREAAFLALLNSLKQEGFISEFLEQWHTKLHPQWQDYNLARQIAFGSSQMALALDYLILQVSQKKKISLKLKEKALLRTAMYQIYFLDRIPLYAVANESIKIAKKYCHRYFVAFLNAILRNVTEMTLKLPEGMDVTSLSIRYSYPPSFIEKLRAHYGLESTLNILEAGNTPAVTMARLRGKMPIQNSVKILMDDPLKVVEVPNEEILKISQSPEYYIQNITPAFLIGNLCKQLQKVPSRVLDMCASPGGKSLVVYDFFPKTALFANDVSLEKTQKLKENFEKFQVQATLSSLDGQLLEFDEKFDVIILDVPCSNSGVLNKRPEARWRLDEAHDHQLEVLQTNLLKHALTLLKQEGEIWYMTCSILPQENEELVMKACRDWNLQVKDTRLILPNKDGWDGGFACSLKQKGVIV